MTDLDNVLRSLESEIGRDAEIKRILQCCPKDYFAIIQINPLNGIDDLAQQLKRVYRRKSLLIHPDKTKNEDAPTAFALLKKAEQILSLDENEEQTDDDLKAKTAEKKALLGIYKEIDERLQLPIQAEFEHADNVNIREKVRLVLESHQKNQEIEKSFAQRQDEQKREALKTAAKERELKKSWESRWEQDRGDRVKLWRNFTAKVEKPKKKKKKLLA